MGPESNLIYTNIHLLVYHVAADMRMKKALRPGILSAGQPLSPSSWHNQWLEAETSGNWQPHHLCARHQPARALTCITSLNPHSSAKRWILVIPLPQVGNPASGLKGFLRSQNRQRWKSSHPHAPGTSPHMFITTWFARERTSNVYRCFPQNN